LPRRSRDGVEALEQARKHGVAEMSEKFIASGAEVYVAEHDHVCS
jgi:hypothetical protein